MRIAHVSTFDSFIRANHVLATSLLPHQVTSRHHVMLVRDGQVTREQILGILGEEPASVLSMEETFSEVMEGGYDWIILSAENTSCRRFFDLLSKHQAAARPRVATIYPGILFRHHVDGLSARMPADLVILNSSNDQRLYRRLLEAVGGSSDNSFNLGPVTALGAKTKPAEGRNKVVFFDQPSVPRTVGEKAYIFRELLKLADRHPELEFCVKLRVTPRQMTLHKGGQDALGVFEACNASASGRRLTLVDGSSRDVIANACLCLSVSSTALIEAIAFGCPAAAITDFGIDEEYGVSFFLGSGITRSFSALDPYDPPVVNPEWIADNLGEPNLRIPCLMEELVRAGNAPAENVAVFPAYGSREFFEHACAEHGLRRALERHYRKPKGSRLRKFSKFLKNRIRFLG
ncbi:MAG: hypothetical protein EOP88_03075 [Verrucomicrobiaceae bacterium]|nr:MAG: hypothetical protein EOP88_03075 [Verrucomicrobiaceae bacterium]